MKVPLTKNITDYLKNIHSKNEHRGIEFMRNHLLNNNIFYKGMNKDIHNVVNICGICELKNNTIIETKNKNTTQPHSINLK